MKKRSVYIVLFLVPILFVVLINEYSRATMDRSGAKNSYRLNPSNKTPKKCTWYCHKNTNYCKKAHTKLLKPYISTIDPWYFKIITSLQATGSYRWANIVFLVVLLPLIMYLLLVGSISLQRKINSLKKA